MSKFDYKDIDGALLEVLVVVVEESSVTRAAQRLSVSQSAVSHLLDKLRDIVGDPLVVRSGRGIVATARAEGLALQARMLLDGLRSFSTSSRFEPSTLSTTFTVAANDLQRDLLLPHWVRRIRVDAPGLRLRVIPSLIPTVEMLRDEVCQLVISPRPPEGSDILQKRLFDDGYRVFYDSRERDAPASVEEYLAAEHISVLHEPRRPLDIDHHFASRGVKRNFAILVPGFAGIPPFLRGSSMLATMPSLLRTDLLRGFATCEVPIECPRMPMYMIWHRRHHEDPMHQWLRNELAIIVAAVLARSSTLAANLGLFGGTLCSVRPAIRPVA